MVDSGFMPPFVPGHEGDRLDSDPTVDFLDKDAVGLNGLCSLS